MIKEVNDFKRKKLFEHYHSFDNPFLTCTIKIDVTNIVNYCKKNKNFYATLGYIITKTVNQLDAFKYRYKGEKIYYCEKVKSNFVDMYDENSIGYFDVEYSENFNTFIDAYIKNKKDFLENENYSPENSLDEIWLSCTPWFNFSSLMPPFNKEISIPQFIWDKYTKTDNKYYVNLLIMVHHGFADGFHIAKFIEMLENNIIKFK